MCNKMMLIVVACLPLLMGNGDQGGGCGCDGGDARPQPTGATCPTGSTLTYATFGSDFMTSFCTRCHSSTKTGDDREGAPADHNFDGLAGVKDAGDHIAEYAGAGPAATNEIMPPGAPRPTDEQRQQLAEWVACGMPE